MKTNWQTKKLGEVCEIELGKTPYRGDKSFWDNEKKTKNVWLSIADLLNGQGKIVSDSKEYISDKGAKISKIVKKGILLVSFKLTLGRLAFSGKDLYTNEAIASLEIKNEKLLDKEFLYYFLSFFDWNKATEGDMKVKGRTLNKSKLKQIQILLPPLSTQKAIVKILDEVFESISKSKENAEKNLKNAKELFESYLEEIFSNPKEDWEEKKLGDIAEIQTGTTPKTSEKDNLGNFIPFIKPADFNKDGSINYNNFGLSEKGLKKSRLIKQNSVLMVCIGATIGKTGFTERNISCNQQINSLTLKKDLFPKLFYYALITKKFQNEVLKNSGQATLPIINKTKWSKLKVAFPKSLPQQTAIVQKLDSLSSEVKQLEEIYKQKVKDLEELKKSMLQKAFSGELTNE